MDDSDLIPSGTALPRPVQVHRQTVATFTPTATPDPADLWEPFTRPTAQTSDGSQGSPLGSYRPGRSIEHEPVDRSERIAMHTAQNAAAHAGKDDEGDAGKPVAFDHVQAGRDIRAALRPDAF